MDHWPLPNQWVDVGSNYTAQSLRCNVFMKERGVTCLESYDKEIADSVNKYVKGEISLYLEYN